MSYPSVESYIISNFKNDTNLLRFQLGKDAKTYIGKNTDIQTNKISEETVMKAATIFLEYLRSEQIDLNIDEFAEASHSIFKKQENDYLSAKGFRVFSMLTLAFLQLGILEI